MLRTNIVDSGLGMEVFGVVMRGWRGDGPTSVSGSSPSGSSLSMSSSFSGDFSMSISAEREEGLDVMEKGTGGGKDKDGERCEEVEDRRVLNAALAAVCNIVMEFSPLKPVSVFFRLSGTHFDATIVRMCSLFSSSARDIPCGVPLTTLSRS